MNIETNITLNDGNTIPMLALGVWRSREQTKAAVLAALKAGYRHIDTAAIYGNEEQVGEAIKESGIPREDIFITTKLWTDDVRNRNTRVAFEESLRKLQVDYVDLYLVHWPAEGYVEAYLEMEALQKEGKVKSIGVSNFKKHHLEDLLSKVSVVPAIDQMEYNPNIQDEALYAFCKERHIILEAWSPLGSGACLDNQNIIEIGKKYNKSSAQVILRWLLQKDIVILPKSVHENRIIENSQLFDFSLTAEDMLAMNQLNKNERTGTDPDHFDF